MDGIDASEGAGAAGFRRANAEQTQRIDRQLVGMEVHLGAGLVAAGVRIVDRPAFVADVTEKVTTRVLRHRRAEMGAETPVDQLAILIRVATARQTADQDDAKALLQPVGHLVETLESVGSGKASPLNGIRFPRALTCWNSR